VNCFIFKISKMENKLIVCKNHDDAIIPKRGSEQAAGYDLYTINEGRLMPKQTRLFDTGISFTVPEGTYGRIAPRSGLSKKGILVNAGVVDRDYTGPVKVMLHNLSDKMYQVNKNDRIAQLIIEKIATPIIEEVESLVDTNRGDGGFGSTGR
jgi:dUTP pyrophosphatase